MMSPAPVVARLERFVLSLEVNRGRKTIGARLPPFILTDMDRRKRHASDAGRLNAR
jgi:hypothetical protein